MVHDLHGIKSNSSWLHKKRRRYKILMWDGENVLEMDYGDGCTTMWIYHWLVHLKMIKMALCHAYVITIKKANFSNKKKERVQFKQMKVHQGAHRQSGIRKEPDLLFISHLCSSLCRFSFILFFQFMLIPQLPSFYFLNQSRLSGHISDTDTNSLEEESDCPNVKPLIIPGQRNVEKEN